MDDPMMRQPGVEGSTLFNSTSRLAGEVAARHSGKRYQKILTLLSREPAAIFEIAEQLGVFDHQISGRFTELTRDGLIERTGERRIKPSTQCQAEVYRLRTTDHARVQIAAVMKEFP